MDRLKRVIPNYWSREKNINNQYYNYQNQSGLMVRKKLCDILMPTRHSMVISLWIS